MAAYGVRATINFGSFARSKSRQLAGSVVKVRVSSARHVEDAAITR
jgi:hypothetical protein